MQKLILFVALTLVGLLPLNAQVSGGGLPASFNEHFKEALSSSAHQKIDVGTIDVEALLLEDAVNDAMGRIYRVGSVITTSYNVENSGTWETLSNGSRVWRLTLKSEGAMALALNFEEEVYIPYGGKLFAYNKAKTHLLGNFSNSTPAFAAMQMVEGDEITLEYIAEPGITELPQINISSVVHCYRGVEEFVNGFKKGLPYEKADNCEVDVACSEGDSWTDQINAVVHYTFVQSASMYVCSASTINNTSNDCTPYILTAWHCGERTAGSSISSWTWYWNYQKATCSTGSANASDPSKGTQTMTGGTVRASSGNGTLNNPPGTNQVAGSDFYLVELNSQPPVSYNVYYAGWDRSNTGSPSGVGIHHPAGSAKKISTYGTTLTSTTYNGGAANAHWRVVWQATANGHGVTEGGSSGSPIFNNSGRIVGQLSGGSSFCTSTSSPDLYGKVYTDWDLCGTTNNARLKPWLDPGNTGVTSMDGAYYPCAPSAPVADFVGVPTTVNVGNNVQFTDLTSGVPTGWSWTITPGSAGVEWSYVTGTSTSQNPQVQFNTVGFYTISLTASNGLGSDTETKVDYIEVVVPTDPCDATSSNCDEYIQNVTLETIDNTTACTNYGDYSAMSTTLTKGQTYTVTVMPAVGATIGSAYTNDEIAVWIDYNNDLDFDDAGEQVGYVLVGTGWSPDMTFTVPMTATAGSLHMRARISYNPDDGAITPCGTSQWGEVEDYTVVLQDPFSSTISLTCPGNSTINASSGGSTVPDLTASATVSTDCPAGMASVTQSPAAGTALSEGSNVITITAMDNCGSTETCTTTITYVNDVTLNLTCGSDVSVLASTDGSTMPNITGDATATSNCPTGSVSVTQSPSAGSALAEGANTVTITATDGCGNVETCTVTVTYTNDVVLNLTCGSDLTYVASVDGTTLPDVTSSASASSNCPSGSVSVAQSPTAGTTMTPGANVVTVTATDGCGNTETCTVTVTYQDDLGIEDASVLTNVMIYPNPTEGNLFVDLTNIPNVVTVELYDLTGKLISTTTNHSNPVVKVDMNNLSRGMYQIRLTSNSITSTHRVSKM